MSRLAALRQALQSPTALATLAAFLPAPLAAAAPAAAPAAPQGSPLLDLHARRHTYLRLSLTERCNLRCTYCMPAHGVALTPAPQLLTPAETLALASHFVGLGVSKIRLTGGEPTTQRALLPTVRALAQLRARGLRTLAMTSNGVALPPPLLRALWSGGLDALNLSLDTLQPGRFAAIARRPPEAWGAAWRAVHGALAAGWGGEGRPLKVNCVVQRGVNEDEAGALARALTQHHPITLRFIEFMPFAGNDWGGQGGGAAAAASAVVPSAELLAALQRELPDVQAVAAAEGSSGALYRGGRDWRGSFAFISTVSSAFCGSCSRLRLTADGALRACLHGEDEVSLRDVLRSGGDGSGGSVEERLNEAIARAVRGKRAALGGRALAGKAEGEGRSMVKIGG
jgi:cyclic pyranopterin phosphate synthase